MVRFAAAIFLLAISTCSSTSSSKGNRMLRVHYFPIGAETLTPVTTENIEERGGHCDLSEPDDVAKLNRLLASATRAARPEEGFTDKKVRVKITQKAGDRNNVLAVVENEGTVRKADSDWRLSSAALAELKTLIESHCR